jgi:Yip1-like protein
MHYERNRSPWSQMAGIVFTPRATFEEINKHPNWLIPFLGVFLLNAGFVYLFFNPGNVSASVQFIQVTGFAVVTTLSILVCSAVFLLCLMIQSAEVSFKKVFAVVTHTYFLYTLITVGLGTIILKLSSQSSGIDPFNPIISNPGILVNQQLHPALYRFASSFDLVSLYFLVLTALGFSIISKKVSFKGALITLMIVWAVYVGVMVLLKFIAYST